MSFKIGDKVVCIKNVMWRNGLGFPSTGPQYNEDLVIDGFLNLNPDFLHFPNWPGCQYFHKSNFRKLDFDFVADVIRQVSIKEHYQEV